MTLPERGAPALSHWERVAAEQPGEGLRPLAFSRRVRGWARLRESWMRRSRRPRAGDVRRSANFLYHPIKPFLHFVIGESKLNKAVAFDSLGSRGVARNLIEVMFAIDLDCQTKIVTAEVSDESRDRHLSAELQSIQPAIAKLLPEHIFARRAVLPQTPRNPGQSVRHYAQFSGLGLNIATPHPPRPAAPSPTGRGLERASLKR